MYMYGDWLLKGWIMHCLRVFFVVGGRSLWVDKSVWDLRQTKPK